MRLRQVSALFAASSLVSVLCFVACSDSSSETPAASAGAAGASASGGASGTSAGGNVGGNAGESAGGGASGASGGGNVLGSPTTSATCGEIPILGQQGKATTAACGACVEANCCAPAATCGANEACIPYRNCVADCTDATCTSACGQTFAGGVSASDGFVACRNKTCAAVCQNLACLGGPLPLKPTAATYGITLQPLDFLSGKVVPNMTIKQCKRDDVACATPVATAITDEAGDATFAAVAVDANGLADYFEITEASYQPQLFFATATSVEPILDGARLRFSTLAKSTWTLLINAAEATLDDTRGHVSFFTSSCAGQGIGMSVAASSSDAASRAVYLADGFPSASATSTDTGGAGAVLNLPPGPVTLAASLASTGQAIGKAHVLARAGYVTTTNLRPGAE